MIGIRGYGFKSMSIKWLLRFGNVIMKVELEMWLVKCLFYFGNVIMKVEILELEWFQTLNFVFIIVLISKLVNPN